MRKLPDFKIEKTVVHATSRKLKATWKVEPADIEDAIFGKDFELEIKRLTQGPKLKEQGWTEVYIGDFWRKITDEWCIQNLKGKYSCMGAWWFFELEEDAAWVILKWK